MPSPVPLRPMLLFGVKGFEDVAHILIGHTGALILDPQHSVIARINALISPDLIVQLATEGGDLHPAAVRHRLSRV